MSNSSDLSRFSTEMPNATVAPISASDVMVAPVDLADTTYMDATVVAKPPTTLASAPEMPNATVAPVATSGASNVPIGLANTTYMDATVVSKPPTALMTEQQFEAFAKRGANTPANATEAAAMDVAVSKVSAALEAVIGPPESAAMANATGASILSNVTEMVARPVNVTEMVNSTGAPVFAAAIMNAPATAPANGVNVASATTKDTAAESVINATELADTTYMDGSVVSAPPTAANATNATGAAPLAAATAPAILQMRPPVAMTEAEAATAEAKRVEEQVALAKAAAERESAEKAAAEKAAAAKQAAMKEAVDKAAAETAAADKAAEAEKEAAAALAKAAALAAQEKSEVPQPPALLGPKPTEKKGSEMSFINFLSLKKAKDKLPEDPAQTPSKTQVAPPAERNPWQRSEYASAQVQVEPSTKTEDDPMPSLEGLDLHQQVALMNARGEAALKRQQEGAPAHERGFNGLLRPATEAEKDPAAAQKRFADAQAAAAKKQAEDKALEDELVPGTFKPRPQEELPAPPVPGAMSFSAFSNGASPFMAFARSGSDYDHVQL